MYYKGKDNLKTRILSIFACLSFVFVSLKIADSTTVYAYTGIVNQDDIKVCLIDDISEIFSMPKILLIDDLAELKVDKTIVATAKITVEEEPEEEKLEEEIVEDTETEDDKPEQTADPAVADTETIQEQPETQEPTEQVAEPVVEAPIVAATPVEEPVAEIPAVSQPVASSYTQYPLYKSGHIQGPSGKETYYCLPMNHIVDRMSRMGFDAANGYAYWVREDGVKMLGNYIMVAANLNVRPRGSTVMTSLGPGLVCDTGSFAQKNAYQLDIATNWRE